MIGDHSSAGRVQAGEADKWWIPHGWRFDGSRRVVVWRHGADGDFRIGPVERWLMDRLGCPWVCASLGGVRPWNGDTGRDRATAAWQWAVANLGAAADKMIQWGGSMGGSAALYYALALPQNVAAVGATIPANVEFIRAGNLNGYAASIEAVHGAGVVPADRQPLLRGAEWAPAVAGHVWASDDDPLSPFATVAAFAAAAGLPLTSLGAVQHSYSGLAGQQGPLDFLLVHARPE